MKNLKNTLLCFILALSFSCNNDDGENLFSESPADRISQQNSELLNLLTSQENGYKGVYFSKNDEFGGATFYMKFNADNTVAITSDFDSETDIVTSRYKVDLGTTSELVFTTRGHIQKMSNPSLAGLTGTGFKGTSVFQYFGNENGTLTFRDTRNRDTGFFVLTPSGFSNFETESVASVNTSLQNREDFVSSENATAFPFLTVTDASSTTSYDLNYDALRFFASPSFFEDDGTLAEENFGIAFTENGLTISPPLVVGDTSFVDFVFDGTNGFEYVSEVDGKVARIGYGNSPATPLDPYDFGVRRDVAVFNMDERSKSSATFNTFYDNFTQQQIDDFGLTISNIILWDLQEDQFLPFIEIRTNFGNFWYDIDFTVTDGIVTFQLTGGTNASPFVTSIFQPLLDTMLLAPSGYYLKKTGDYLNFSNQTFSLINVEDAKIWFNYWDF